MPAPRQVIVIMTDTQRSDMLGCYGNPDMRTPALDRLAAQGLRFARAHCCQPVCGPARSALFTGLYPHSNGSWANSMALAANVKTVGQRLSDNGMHSAYIGKWHLDGGDYFGLGRCPDGWDPGYWYDMHCYLEELSPEDRVRSRQTRTMYQEEIAADFTFGHRCSQRAIDFLARHATEDFLLVLSYDEPHGPHLCPKPFADMYRDYEWPQAPAHRDTLEGKPEHQRIWGAPRRDRAAAGQARVRPAALLGCNAFVDHEIGRVIEAIDRHAPEALVVYTSDHGDALGAHALSGKGPAMYDEITRIPLIVRWPGHVAPGGTCAHPVSHIDLVPTILAAVGLPQPRWLEGTSLLATLRHPAQRPHEAVFMEFGRFEIDHDGFGGFQPIRAACDGRYKLVINLLSTDEFYDLQADPYELDNRIQSPDHAAMREALHGRLLDWMNRTRDPFRGYYWEHRSWRADAPQATWAYTGMTRQRENEEYEPRQLDYDTGLPMTQAVRHK